MVGEGEVWACGAYRRQARSTRSMLAPLGCFLGSGLQKSLEISVSGCVDEAALARKSTPLLSPSRCTPPPAQVQLHHSIECLTCRAARFTKRKREKTLTGRAYLEWREGEASRLVRQRIRADTRNGAVHVSALLLSRCCAQRLGVPGVVDIDYTEECESEWRSCLGAVIVSKW